MKITSLFLIGCALLSCASFFPANSQAQSPYAPASLHKDLTASKHKLDALEDKILKEKHTINKQLTTLEKEVLTLRKKSSSLLRAQDERALSLAQLDQRLQSWEAQRQFQDNLLARFLMNSSINAPATNRDQTQLLADIDLELHQRHASQGQFYQAPLILPDGREISAKHLSIGPLQYFIADQSAGIAHTENGLTTVLYQFNRKDQRALRELAQNGSATIPMDPSNGRAITRINEQESLAGHIEKGGIWAIPILLFAIFATIIAGFKTYQVVRLPTLIANIALRIEHIWKEKTQLSALKLGPWQRELVDICSAHPVGQKRDDRLFNALGQQKQKLDNLLGAIATTAAVSPLLGLLGTVSGMIETFKLMTLFGAGDPAAVSGGISEALVTTELGLIVAIPALLSHAFLSRKVKSYYHQLEQSAIELSQLNYPDHDTETTSTITDKHLAHNSIKGAA